MNPGNADIQLEYQKGVETICHKLAENKGKDFEFPSRYYLKGAETLMNTAFPLFF